MKSSLEERLSKKTKKQKKGPTVVYKTACITYLCCHYVWSCPVWTKPITHGHNLKERQQIHNIMVIIFFSYFLFSLGISFSVQHCSPMMPRVECTNKVLPWLRLTAKSLSFIAPAPQVRCSNWVSSDGNKFGALPGIEPRTFHTRIKDLNHCTTLLLIILIPIVFQYYLSFGMTCNFWICT